MAPVPAVPAALPLTRPQLRQRLDPRRNSPHLGPRPRRPPQPPLKASNKYPQSALPATGDNCICFPDELENAEQWDLPRARNVRTPRGPGAAPGWVLPAAPKSLPCSLHPCPAPWGFLARAASNLARRGSKGELCTARGLPPAQIPLRSRHAVSGWLQD